MQNVTTSNKVSATAQKAINAILTAQNVKYATVIALVLLNVVSKSTIATMCNTTVQYVNSNIASVLQNKKNASLHAFMHYSKLLQVLTSKQYATLNASCKYIASANNIIASAKLTNAKK